jgi:JmjC domain, hydroxylase
MRLRAVNLNHGPGDVEWYCVEPDEADKLRLAILRENGIDIMKKEHRWYLTIQATLKYGVKLVKLIQRAGDIVVLAPGTLHWVRSHQVTVNSAWNLGYLDHNQMQQIYRRFHLNRQVDFENLFAVRTMTLDIINYAFYKLDFASRDITLKNYKWMLDELDYEDRFIKEFMPSYVKDDKK